MTLSEEHRSLLQAQAISDRLIDAVCESGPDGIRFNFTGPTGRKAVQTRLDEPDVDTRYVGPPGQPSVMPVPPGHQHLVLDPTRPLTIVEGSKGHLAVATALEGTTQPIAVVGMLGCWGWSSGRRPTEDFLGLPMEGRQVIVFLDADLTSNRQVWEAAKALQEHLRIERGAASVRFAKVPGRDKEGMDDILARSPGEATFRRILATATDHLGRAPAASRGGAFGSEGYSAVRAADLLMDRHHLATGGGTVFVYRDGVYHNGDSRMFEALAADLMGDSFTKARFRDVEFTTVSRLTVQGRVVPEFQDRLLIPFRNGLLDPETMALHPHDPSFVTARQFDVEWDPNARCPFYEEWTAAQMLPGALEDLEEVVSQMFDMTRAPRKAGLLFGPSRSGKGTFLRLVEKCVGQRHLSSVSLHDLSDPNRRFATSGLYGKALNVHADLSGADLKDISTLKMALGDDVIWAEYKGRDGFSFRNTALMLFAANTIPVVSEASQAYFGRVKPFEFPHTFLGREDEEVSHRLRAELPGIVVRWVRALKRLRDRGRFLETLPDTDREFRRGSDRVVEFLATHTAPGGFTSRTDLWRRFQEDAPSGWSKTNFYRRVENAGVRAKKGSRAQGLNGVRGYEVTLIDPEEGDGKQGEAASRPLPPHIHSSRSHPLTPQTGVSGKPLPLLPLDLETGPAEDLHRPGGGFVRLVGTPRGNRPDPSEALAHSGVLVAHNGFAFDFPALAVHHGLDLLSLSEEGRLYDTKIGAILADPPRARLGGGGASRYYGLDASARRWGHKGKTDDVTRLARKHGGFDRIPLSDPQYNAYLAGDVRALEALLPHMPTDEYARREMRLMGRLSHSLRVTGWRVDTALLAERLREHDAVVEEGVAALKAHGFPTHAADGTPYTKPHLAKGGPEALEATLRAAGVSQWPTTDRTGRVQTSRDAWQGYRLTPAAGPVMEAIWSLNGNRTIYGTVESARVGDRVYPEAMPYQASGRFSITPGITVMGKRGGKAHERSVYLPEPGHVLAAFDLNQIDARAIAMHCEDPAYMALFQDPSIDAHMEIAHRLWGVRDKKHREMAKAIGHGWNYGEGLPRISRDTGLDPAAVREFDAGMRQSFPGLVEWKRATVVEAESGRLLDNGFGRKMRPDPERAWTQGPALMGQGLARDLMAEGILRLPVELVGNLRAVIHDELVFSIPADQVEDYTQEVRKAMEFEFRTVPVTAGFEGSGPNWGAVYSK